MLHNKWDSFDPTGVQKIRKNIGVTFLGKWSFVSHRCFPGEG